MKERESHLGKIAQEFGLETVYVFGSQAKEVEEWIRHRRAALAIENTSDVDVGVKPLSEKRLTHREKARLTMDLEDFFSVNRVDLVIIQDVDPFLAANIIRGERIYEADRVDADEYELYILRRAGDLAPLEREKAEMILGKP